MEVKLDPVRLFQAKSGRNSGRTFDALAKALLTTKEHPCVVFLTACDGEVNRLGRDIAMICEHYGIEYRKCSTPSRFAVGSSDFYVLNANDSMGRGCRANFHIDHSCRELMSPAAYDEMVASIRYAQSGEWPLVGVRN